MSGFNLKRKMKRTKQQELRVVESNNRQDIGTLAMELNRISEMVNGTLSAVLDLQKNYLALVNALKRQRVVDDLMIHQERGQIDEFERMKKQAVIIDGKKEPNGG